MKKKDTLFEEVQYLSQFRFIFAVLIFIEGIMAWTLWQLIHEQIYKPDQVNTTDTIIGFIAICIGFVLITHLAFFTRLITQVTKKGLFVRYIPFHFWTKEIDLKNIKHIEAKQYRPIIEYGGWGIRLGWKKKAYNVYGNKGVEIIFKNDHKLLIGSQHPNELADAIQSILK